MSSTCPLVPHSIAEEYESPSLLLRKGELNTTILMEDVPDGDDGG